MGTLRRVRSGACLILVVLAAGAASTSARADGTTVASTTTTTTATTTSTTTAYAPLAASSLPSSCLGAGGVLIEEPGQVVALDTPATGLGASGYPADASVVAFSGASGSGSACRTGNVMLSGLSLFGGAVTASAVTAKAGQGRVFGLELNGSPLAMSAGETTYVDGWGELTRAGTVGRISAPLVLRLVRAEAGLPAGTVLLIGYSEAPVPVKQTTTAKATPAQPSQTPPKIAPAVKHAKRVKPVGKQKRHRHKKRAPQPLKVTPPLGKIHYVFPVDGGASYGDTYGGNRSDIYDGWHHGDDLFASLGTPVVAVSRGTLSLVGWNELGGWRLWLTDKYGNSFYYAHLSGYARWILHHRHVKAGQVIGFLGRTGDAFTTAPHLHFEVHPQPLLKLGYDGAVDPTTYLQSWKVVRVPKKGMPQPARLRAPAGTPRQEAAVVWHELLVARHLVSARSQPAALPYSLRRPLPGEPDASAASTPLNVAGAVRVAEHVAAPLGPGLWPTAVAAGVLALGGFGLFFVGRRRRWAAPAMPVRLADLARAARRARAPR